MKEGEIWGGGKKAWAAGEQEPDADARVVHAPTASGPGDGLAFFFLFGLNRHRKIDQMMVGRELEAIADDIEVLTGAGFTAVVHQRATKDDLVAVLQGKAEAPPAAIYWSAHGHPDGSVEASDGGRIHPSELDEVEVSDALRLFVMSACYSASRSRTWRTALGGKPMVVGWGRPVTIDRAVDFLTPKDDTESDLDDLIRRFLIQGEPIPDAVAQGHQQPAWSEGEVDRIEPLISSLGTVLDAKWRNREGALEMLVPTQDRRTQEVRICSVRSAQPLFEGQALFAAESEVGEIAGAIDPRKLIEEARPGLSRVALVQGPADLPVVLVQGFMVLQGATVQQLAGLIQEVAHRADDLEQKIFGADVG